MSINTDYFGQSDLSELNTSKLTGLKNILTQIDDKFGQFHCSKLLYKQSIKPYINRILPKKNTVRIKIKFYLYRGKNINHVVGRLISLINKELKRQREINLVKDSVDTVRMYGAGTEETKAVLTDLNKTYIETLKPKIDAFNKVIDDFKEVDVMNCSIYPEELMSKPTIQDIGKKIDEQLERMDKKAENMVTMLDVCLKQSENIDIEGSEFKPKKGIVERYLNKADAFKDTENLQLLPKSLKLDGNHLDIQKVKPKDEILELFKDTETTIISTDDVDFKSKMIEAAQEQYNNSMLTKPRDLFVQKDLAELSWQDLCLLDSQIYIHRGLTHSNIDNLIDVIKEHHKDSECKTKLINYISKHNTWCYGRLIHLIDLEKKRRKDEEKEFNDYLSKNEYYKTVKKITEVAFNGPDLEPVKQPIANKIYQYPKDYFVQADLQNLTVEQLEALYKKFEAKLKSDNPSYLLPFFVYNTIIPMETFDKIKKYLQAHNLSAFTRIFYLIKLEMKERIVPQSVKQTKKEYKSMMDFNIK